MNVDDTSDSRLYSWDDGKDRSTERDVFEFQCALKNASRWLESVDEYDRLIAEQQGRPHMNIYHPHTNSFWFGMVCGICVATSAAMFMIVTRLLGIWS